MAGLQGSGKTTATAKLAKQLKEQNGSSVAVAACDVYRPAAVEQLIKVGAQAGATVYEQGTDKRPGRHRRLGAGPGQARRQGRPDRRHVGPPARRPGADGRAGQHQEGRQAARRPARRRRDDRPGRRQRRRAVRRGRAIRRRGALQARRRRPRRRRAVGQGGHRQADHVRVDRREAGRLREVPSRPHGPADPGDGRRPVVHREGRAVRRRGRGEGTGAQDAQEPVHARGLPGPDEADPQDGPAHLAAGDDPRAGGPPALQAADRRARDGPRRGDHPLDDPGGAPPAGAHQGIAPPAHRQGLWRHRPAGQPAGQAVRRDAQDDEGPLVGQDARPRPAHAPDGESRSLSCRAAMSVSMRLTRVGGKKDPVWRVVVADSRSPRDGRVIETIGRYNAQTEPSTVVLDEERARLWLSRGAQPSNTVRKLLKIQGIS